MQVRTTCAYAQRLFIVTMVAIATEIVIHALSFRLTNSHVSKLWTASRRATFLRVPACSCIPTASRSLGTESTRLSSTSGLAHESVHPERLRLLNGIRDIVNDYDHFLIDMWGVMHDGSRPYAGVLEVIQRLKCEKKKLTILSNSSKRRDSSIAMLRKLGFDPTDFDQILTSGEIAYNMLAQHSDLKIAYEDEIYNKYINPWEPLVKIEIENRPRKVVVLGSGDDDETYINGCGWRISDLAEASLIIARGTFTINCGPDGVIHKKHDHALYDKRLAAILAEAAQRQIPMLVTNPDKVRPDADLSPMPGMLGDLYEAALLLQSTSPNPLSQPMLVKRIGKPFPDVYGVALRRHATNFEIATGSTSSLRRVCMVGDALETDVAGATNVRIEALWILCDGIHKVDLPMHHESDDSVLEARSSLVLKDFNIRSDTYSKGRQLQPTALLRHFQW